jgi:hypothetical protein
MADGEMLGSRRISSVVADAWTLMMGTGESMKSSGTGRVLAILFLGIMRGLYSHFSQMRWLGRGREAFLADQGSRFDKFAAYHPTGTMLIAGIILVAVAAGLYELVAAGITKVVPPSTVEE